MKSTNDRDFSFFMDSIEEKVCALGGRSNDLNHFFGSNRDRFYEEVVNRIASRIIWLTTKEKQEAKSFEVEVDYNPNSVVQKIDDDNYIIYCGKPKYFDTEIGIRSTCVEHIQLRSIDTQQAQAPKNIRASVGGQGFRTCTILHAFSIKRRAEMDPIFKKKILPFLPIYFIGAVYPCERLTTFFGGKVRKHNVYVSLCSNTSNTLVEEPSIIWCFPKTQGYLHTGHVALY